MYKIGQVGLFGYGIKWWTTSSLVMYSHVHGSHIPYPYLDRVRNGVDAVRQLLASILSEDHLKQRKWGVGNHNRSIHQWPAAVNSTNQDSQQQYYSSCERMRELSLLVGESSFLCSPGYHAIMLFYLSETPRTHVLVCTAMYDTSHNKV